MSNTDKVNILIVDDLAENLLVYESILGELGQNVITARSGEQALRRVLEHDFAVILLDVNMPGMDGLETAAFIRQRKRSARTPIIFVTAYTDDVHAARGYSLGAVDYILSPVMPEVLRTKVKVFVELFQMHQEVKQQATEHVALAREQAARAAAEEATRRSAFLAEASSVLARSLDVEETLRGLARVVVPFLGDAGIVAALDSEGRTPQVETAWISSDQKTHSCPLRPGAALPAPLGESIERVLARGKPELLAHIERLVLSPEPQNPAQDDDGVSNAELALHSAMVLPLVARGRILGTLAIAAGPSGRRYTMAELSLAEHLADRGAIAIDNAQLHRSIQEADQRKDEFLAMLAHELRNPMAPIRNAVELLKLHDADPEKLSWARDVIDRQTKHMIRLVDDLLDVSRITRGKIRLQKDAVDVAAVVASAVEISQPIIDARNHKLSVSIPSEPLALEGDTARLAQILANLLNNSAKYTEPGGRIWLTVEREEPVASAHTPQAAVVLRVRDTGVGIPSEMLPQVFNLFSQVDHSLDRSQGGLGIGLTLVRQLVEMHGGTVEAFSDGAGQGSEFVVRLPMASEQLKPKGPPAEAAERPGDLTPRRILVVDDHEDVAECLAMLLRDMGHDVRVAHDGKSTFELARTFQPDVVLLDIGLPRMDGYQVARRLREEHDNRDLLLVALTGYGQDEDRRRAEDAGFDEHLLKPAGIADLERVLGHTSLSQ